MGTVETKSAEATVQKTLLNVLRGEAAARTPFWLMRQAGRYLSEYRALRARVSGFLELCYTPELAAEVTLQPIRRFAMDGAIIFSDILVIPHALGLEVRFVEGEGPLVERLGGAGDLARLGPVEGMPERLEPVYAALRTTRAALPAATTLIGFAGAPWTLACYMIEGSASRDFARIKAWMFADRIGFGRLLQVLADAVAAHLIAQVDAGADAVQLFDSWAGVVPAGQVEACVTRPVKAIVDAVRVARPGVPIILFPRAAGLGYEAIMRGTGVDAIGIDATVPPAWAAEVLQPFCTVQGNLDPLALLVGGAAMTAEVAAIEAALGRGRYVFNLGHGVLPETPPEHVAALAELLRGEA